MEAAPRQPARAGSTEMKTVRTVADLRRETAAWRRAGLTIGLVPTMGALHDGHLSLLREARRRTDRTITTIFVNPKQFGPREDFAAYPRTEETDSALLRRVGNDLLFAPPVSEVYPKGFVTSVAVAGISEPLEGAHRPGHFGGVATVVAKLLGQSLPDIAFFGEKDYQQLQVIKRMARDLDLPVEIVGLPTVRDSDGLALSSRNVYLSPKDRAIAPALHRVLDEVARRVAAGEAPAAAEAEGRKALERAGFARIEYLAVADAETLTPITGLDRPARVLVAAWLGETRLIDNVAVSR